MPISETVGYITVFGLTVIFTVFALTMKENKIFLKLTAALAWMVMALLQFVVGNTITVLSLALPPLFAVFGILFIISTIKDWYGEKHDRIWKFED